MDFRDLSFVCWTPTHQFSERTSPGKADEAGQRAPGLLPCWQETTVPSSEAAGAPDGTWHRGCLLLPDEGPHQPRQK